MITFVLRKMLSKKWMVLCLLIGNILLTGIACLNPVYEKAVLQRTLTKNLQALLTEDNRYPGTITMTGSLTIRSNAANTNDFLEAEAYQDALIDLFGQPPIIRIKHYSVSNVRAYPEVDRGGKEYKALDIGAMSGLDGHVEMLAGRLYGDGIDADGVIDVIVSQSMLIKQDLLLSEVYTLADVADEDGNALRIRIAGVFTAKDREDVFFYRPPSYYSAECFMSEDLFYRFFVDFEKPKYPLGGNWVYMMDYENIKTDDVARIMDAAKTAEATVTAKSGFKYSDTFSSIISAYLVKAQKVKATLTILQVPILLLLVVFIFMVTQQMLQMEQNEIAILKSRGAEKRQILYAYILQSVILAIVSACIGIGLSLFLCQVLGSANGFLEFVRRSALPASIDKRAVLYAAGAALFSILVMVLPVIRYAETSIVEHKQKRSRAGKAPLWQRLFIDVIFLAVSLYGLYTYDNQKDVLAQRVIDGASVDPLLFFASSLFILGAGMLALRVIPLIVHLVYAAFRRVLSPGLYASFLRILRVRDHHGFIMLFLITTVALGIFNAQTARTINSNEEERIRYLSGAEIVLREKWSDNSQSASPGDPTQSASSSEEIEYYEPDFNRFVTLEGVESATKVLDRSDIILQISGGTISDVRVLGINTKEYGQTVPLKDGLLTPHYYEYLNAISQNSRAVLLSSNFEELYGLKIGDVVYFKRKSGGSQIRGVIYGFVDYFPAYSRHERKKGADGLITERENFLIVANLDQLQSTWGVLPYDVYIKTNGPKQFIYDYIEENTLQITSFKDQGKEIVEMKNDPVIQGTNGILTVGFIVILMLCTVGFLIYWILSIESRKLQFGIFRAMGMSVKEIIGMLLNEQVFLSGLSIAAGALIGKLASQLYIPLLQIAYSAADQPIPLSIVSRREDMLRLFGIIGTMIVICLAVLGVIIKNIRISQTLKLGEDG